MIDTIAQLPDAAHKDAHPMDTVKRIKEILREHGIETEEKWSESDVPYCYSLRIDIAGTAIGSNGKGVNKEFAIASGYGELIERLQLGMVWKNKLQVEGGASSCEAQSETVCADDLLKKNLKWYTAYAQELKETTGVSITERELLEQYTDGNGYVQATPYYCVTTNTKEYIPTALCKAVYATSGGAAGNTMEEAMVQALSEIVERHYKLRVIVENIAVPEIPEDVLQTCPIAYDIIRHLRSNGFRVIIKDCSLGTKFPVVCVCIIDTNTGKYHTHFGAYPDFEIALQRTLTESFQGRNIHNITRHEDFTCKEKEAFDMQHLMHELVLGTSEKPPQFFIRTPQEPYRKTEGFAGKTNKERLKECIAFFRDQGFDILVRDSSCLGFPTCQIIIPGYSEVFPQRMTVKYDDTHYGLHASKALKNPVSAKMQDLIGLLAHMAQCTKLRFKGVEGFIAEAGLPAKLSAGEDTYLMSVALAHVNYTLGKTADVVRYIDKALRTGACADREYLLCVKRYLSLKQNKYNLEDIRTALEYFHKPETVERIYSSLNQNVNPLDSVVLRCNMECGSDCLLYGRCQKKQSDRIVQLIVDKSKNLDQSEIRGLLQNL